jgi:peptidoglycan/xylan/chitin deacetylase (PgdA/CDA1 family)
MWWAGVAWRGGDFEVAVVDDDGIEVVPATTFAGRHAPALIELLQELSGKAIGGLSTVIDSTNGMLDGHLLAAGLTVYRADPPLLAQRPILGSVPGADLACCGARFPDTLHHLTTSSGALAGRVDEYLDLVARSARTEQELIDSGQCIERGSGTVPEIAITFDDGPHPVYTPRVLDILARYQAPATFFCVGLNLNAYPELAGRAAEAGHLVGNHTWSHPYLPDLTRDELLHQVDATNAALTRAVGESTVLVRPPYGARSPELLGWLAGHGMTTVLWDIDTTDWAGPGTDTVVAEARRASDGSVVLMHDAGGDRTQTIEALPRILEHLLERGYRFVTIDRLSRHPVAGPAS